MRRFLCIAVLLGTLITWSGARTLDVPSTYPTIAAALLESVTGDTILVAEGVYPEALRIDRGITLRGSDTWEGTRIVSTSSDPAVWVQTHDVTLLNLSIVGASGAVRADTGTTRLDHVSLIAEDGLALELRRTASAEVNRSTITRTQYAMQVQSGSLTCRNTLLREVRHLGTTAGGLIELTQCTLAGIGHGFSMATDSRVTLNSCVVAYLAGALADRVTDGFSATYTDLWAVGNPWPVPLGLLGNRIADPLFTQSMSAWALNYTGLAQAPDSNYVFGSACGSRVVLLPEEEARISAPDDAYFQLDDYCFQFPEMHFFRMIAPSVPPESVFAFAVRLRATGGSEEPSWPGETFRIGFEVLIETADTTLSIGSYRTDAADTSLVDLCLVSTLAMRSAIDTHGRVHIILRSLYSNGDWGFGFLRVDFFELYLIGLVPDSAGIPGPTSPMRDSGDPLLPHDPDGSLADRGCGTLPWSWIREFAKATPDLPLWPDPAWDFLSAMLPARAGRMEIRDLQGRCLLSESSGGGLLTLRLQSLFPGGLPSGTYFLCWREPAGRDAMARFTVMQPRR